MTIKKADPAASPATEQASGAPDAEPIIIDMGKKNRKDIRKLTKGKPGKLMRRLDETIEHLRENGALTEGAQPVVIVVRQKPKRRGRRIGKLWGLG